MQLLKRNFVLFLKNMELVEDIINTTDKFLTEVKELYINGGDEENLIIESDNLIAPKLLERMYKNKIYAVYTDSHIIQEINLQNTMIVIILI